MTVTRAEKLIGGVERIGYVDKGRFEAVLRERYVRTMRSRQNRFRLMETIRHLPANEWDVTLSAHVMRLKEIVQPVLVSWGEQDPLLAPGAGERLARELGRGVYRGYGDLAHMPHEEAAERVGREWASFLNDEIQMTNDESNPKA